MHRSENHTTAAEERSGESVLQEMKALFGPDTAPDRFVSELLAAQCRLVKAEGGVLMKTGPENRIDILGIHPPLENGKRFEKWVSQAAEDYADHVISSGQTSIKPEAKTDEANSDPQRHIIVVPVEKEGSVCAAAAFAVWCDKDEALRAYRDQLEFTPFMLNFNYL
ncbi:MAG: hypothetical protein JRH15_23405 [Deltaproteobacteria bacterium]|nr:hypothetical protein [Deltaproteobacteria bacterium]